MNMKNEGLHIGLTGQMASGKGEVVRILSAAGFQVTSLSDMVRTEGKKRYGTPSRQQLQDTGNSLRQNGGPGILGRLVAEQISAQPPGHWLIDGIRNPAEIDELRILSPFFLLGISTDTDTLLTRLHSRQRSDDQADAAELRQRLDREWGIGEPDSGQQVGRCLAQADQIIDNTGTLSELKAKLHLFLEQYLDQKL